MNKRGFLCMGAFLLSIALIGSTVLASSGRRRDEVVSRGTVNYDHGKIVITSDDLIKLADGMDDIEYDFKSNIMEALAEMKTYVQPDGSVSHDDQTDINPRQIMFRELAIAILQSQSVAHLAGTQVSDSRGLMYYKFEPNNILEVTAEDTGMPVYILPASEDNLSAQTAAWVDGRYLAGNGFDNYYFYQKGYIEGYAARMGASVEYQYDDTGRMESAKLIFP